ncbi:MAG: glycosyltransferase [Bacteriovoracia bacterium]
MKVAIVHDWLVSQRGGENVLDAICELFPKAEVFTLVYSPGKVAEHIALAKKNVSLLKKIPSIERRYRHFLPVMPWVIEQFDLSGFDLVLSSSHCVAKGVIKPESAFHLSYVHAPMRYMWDRFDEYFSKERSGLITRTAAQMFRGYLQKWDQKSATRVDAFLANSKFIASKIKTYYNREAKVVYPFCETTLFNRERIPGRNYLMVTALVPYKRVDLAIRVFNRLKKNLIVVGDGPDKVRLQKLAGPTIDFLGAVKGSSLCDLYSRCKALVFPGVEDFGIVPLEAMASGAPVIAFGQGGVLETVTEETGMFFYENTEDALESTLIEFERRCDLGQFDSKKCRARGRSFPRIRFQSEYLAALRQFAPARIASSLEIPRSVTEQLQGWSEEGLKNQSLQL